MLGFRLHKRHDVVSEVEFSRSKHIIRFVAIIWAVALIIGVMMIDLAQWYNLAGMIAIFTLTLPSPTELFQSYEHYKKKWLRHGGASRGERVARMSH
jgi:cell division protein FtsW (lipid II flippase)